MGKRMDTGLVVLEISMTLSGSPRETESHLEAKAEGKPPSGRMASDVELCP